MDKRALRKISGPNRKLNCRSGVFYAEQIQYVVCTEVKNIAHRRTLVLYVYDKERVLAGDSIPKWTVFQSKEEYIALCRDEEGTRWHQSMFNSLNREYCFSGKCSFYSYADEERVTRFCQKANLKGFNSLDGLQYELFCKRQKARRLKSQKKIAERMKPVKSLPRDIKGFIFRETLPHYIFYDYVKGKAPRNACCTACRHEVFVTEAKHNGKGICPRCKSDVIYKSRGRRGNIVDRSTVQVIQRAGENEVIIRIVKSYCRYCKSDTPKYDIYENARLFLFREDGKPVKQEDYYYCYDRKQLTPWHKGKRPGFGAWSYNFEADYSGYLYHRNLENELKGTPWQYSALKEYYMADPTPLYVDRYLNEYLHYPMLEYLVKLKLFRLATYVVYGDADGSKFYGNNEVLNSSGKTLTEILGVEKKHVPFLQTINPGGKQLKLIKSLLREGIELDVDLLKWCSENSVGNAEYLTVPLRYMTPHRLLRYATEQFAAHRKISNTDNGYYSVNYMMSDYKDYLCMCMALDHDMKSSFVLFPNDLKAAHDRVNDLNQAEITEAYDRRIAKMFNELQERYSFKKMGFMVIAPRSSKEIIREGDKLHHCVGRYVKDVVKDNCTILFIRKASAPKEPFCTVEIKHGDIVQARIQNNGSPPPEVQRFIELWKQQVLYAPATTAA